MADNQSNDRVRLVTATSPGSAEYATNAQAIGGTATNIFVDPTNSINNVAYTGPSNGVYATVTGTNQIQINLDNIDYGMGMGTESTSFSHSQLLVIVQDANDSLKSVTISLDIDTNDASDTIRLNSSKE